jgi:hypothetical protein
MLLCSQVTWRTSVPSILIVRIFQERPSRRPENAIRVPSGDHTGSPTEELSFVTRRDTEPFRVMMQMCVPPLTKASRLPFGDQEGCQAPWSPPPVIRRSPVPSRLMT